MAVCIKCGANMADDSRFCMQCGTPREEQPAMEQVIEAPTVEPVIDPVIEAPTVELVMETPEVEPVQEEVIQLESQVMEAPKADENIQPVFEAEIPAQPVMQPNMPTGQGFQFTAPAQPAYQGQQMPVQPTFSAVPPEPQKKSKGPIIAILSAAVLALVAIVVAIVMLLQPNVAEIDLSQYVEITYDGYDTTGTAYVYLNESKLLVDILKAQGEDTSTNKISFSMKALINSIELETEYYENLSNGQKITIKIKYDPLLMEENDVEFKNASKEYTVKDLVELIPVDPFEDVTVTFDGASPEGYASYNNDSDIDCVDWASMEFDKRDGLKNGDVVKLTVDPDDVDYAVSKGYRFTATSKEYTVEGLDYYYNSIEEISEEHMAEYQKAAEEELEIRAEWIYDAEMTDIKVIGTYFAKSTVHATNNKIVFVYTATLTSTEGDFDPTTIYIPVSMKVTRVEDGKLGDLYAYTDGTIFTEVGYNTYYGYISGDIMYTEYIVNELSSEYEVIPTEGMPEFKETTDENRLPASTQAPTENPTEGSTEGESSSAGDNGLF